MAATHLLLSKEVRGLVKELKGAEENAVAVLKLNHQKEIQGKIFITKTTEIEVTYPRNVMKSWS